MYLKTHLTITLFVVLLVLSFFDNKVGFIIIALIATLIPDVDTKHSRIGKHKIFRPLQFFFGHRGPIHSLIFLILICFLLNLWNFEFAVAFFIGFGLHLIADSFTKMGVYIFWPLKKRFFWKIKTGGNIENFIFTIFLAGDAVLILREIYSIF